ncbi:MAG TPA: helix-turn-helix domain-containing protein [Patescibacteria group bacterium]|nr:helix-turn-helix domain-containing protein [Patescibacteria group bacterium]
MNQNVELWLKSIGLNEAQAAVYLATLSVGDGNTKEISEKSGVSRTGIYEYLVQLEEEGLVREVKAGGRKKYVALHPKELYKRQQGITSQLKDLLPDFLALYAQDSKAPFIQQFEGSHAAREIYEDILSSGAEEYSYISAPHRTYGTVEKAFIKDWISRRVKKGIHARALRVPSDQSPKEEVFTSEEKYLRQIRYLPGYIDLKATIYIYGNNVGIVSARDEAQAYLIYSPDFSFTMKSVFDLLWQIGTHHA